MERVLILAEKPSQAKAYADAFPSHKRDGYIEIERCSALPSGATLTWGIGHLVELREPKAHDAKWTRWSLDTLPIFPSEFQFQVARGKAKQFAIVKKLLKEADVVINACDTDREGSNIFYSIYRQTRLRGHVIKRLWIHSLEPEEIRRGFARLDDNARDLRLYDEARTRQIGDWLVGMNASRLYSLALKQRGAADVFSVGRVQSPTLFLIYERERAIASFKPEPFFEIEGSFQAAGGLYKGKAKFKSKSREEALALLRKHGLTPSSPGLIRSVQAKPKQLLPPKLHSLSTLQTAANKRWRYSPAAVLDAAQTLYEKKLISYPRTDSQHISEAEFRYLQRQVPAMKEAVRAAFPSVEAPASKRFVDGAKVQEHYAIIPTKRVLTPAKLEALPAIERHLYEEVLRTALGMFHSPYRYTETTVSTDVAGLLFWTIGKTETDRGWKELYPAKEPSAPPEPALPPLIEGEAVQSRIGIEEGVTTPPKPFTEGQLITVMKTCGNALEESEAELLKEIEGIGTEATRSRIIETLKQHGYIAVRKNIVSLTAKGRVLCTALEGTLLASPSMTAKWERYLHKIGEGEGSPSAFLASLERFLQQLVADVPAHVAQAQLPDVASIAPQAKRKGAKKGRRAIAIAACPACQTGQIVQRPSFYSCSRYRDGCKQAFPGSLLGRDLAPEAIRQLCERGATEVLDGFRSKQGGTFSAALRLDGGKLTFDFRPQAEATGEPPAP